MNWASYRPSGPGWGAGSSAPGWRCGWKCGVPRGGFPPAVEIALFRVLQEALNNVWKHSGARKAAVALYMHQDRVRLVVYDRGKGFDPDALPPESFGLAGMRERVQFLGGNWWVKSRPGRGTQVGAEIPLPAD